MIRFLFVAVLVISPWVAGAHWPVLLEDVPQNAVEIVPDPALSRAYYGTLEGNAHTYEFELVATSTVFIQTLSPELSSGQELVLPTGLLVEMLANGRAKEVTRLYPDQAEWQSEYEPFGGDSYRQGPVFEAELPAGRYRFEVSTPDNETKYVLAIGTEERWGGTNPFVLIGRIYQVKEFFEKPWYAVFQSPFYYVPAALIVLIAGFWYWRRRTR